MVFSGTLHTSVKAQLIFIGTLQLHCNFRYSHKMLSVVVFRLSVTGVYCDKTTEDSIMQFSLKCSPMSDLLPAKFDSEIRRGSL